MGPIRIRSVLLAAAVISNCITWTASRHHYTHNVAGHRSRHRRQGAGLYLPASYVLPGGEGSGAWGEWGEVSPCSRSCGGGVASQKRICLEFSPDGRPSCSGGDTKYFSCQTQDCPEGTMDFRAEQCAQYDHQLFKGLRYSWVPYTKGPNPCQLNCMPKSARFYYRHADKVVDGTRCNDESFDVCVDGICQPVGCDMMLGSNAKEDNCRECRGNNTNCRDYRGSIPPETELIQGYNDVLLIPAGATSINIRERDNSNNYLALRSKTDGRYYLNGDYHIDFPRTLSIAGALWHYERSQQGFAAPDKLRCQGPTNEPLYLSLLLQDPNVGIDYDYSLPMSVAPPPNQQYVWVHDDYTPCSASCGGGTQTRNVTCRSREELETVDDTLCDQGMKPPVTQACNTQPCAAHWAEGPWGPCNKPCGEGGTRNRTVTCEKIITNGETSTVADKECIDRLGEKPPLFQECPKDSSCPKWYTGPWLPCDVLCGEGKQTRQVVCYQKDEKNQIETLSDENCLEEKPTTTQPCTMHPCVGVDWVTSDWSGCDTCTSKVRTRIATCSTKDNVVAEEFCAEHKKPILEEECDKSKLPACDVQWYATQWSKCSVECGKGVKTRKVFCGLFDGSSVVKVDDSRCNDEEKYNDSIPCETPMDNCPAKWFTGPWGECSDDCYRGGEKPLQYRSPACIVNNTIVFTACKPDEIPTLSQECNTQPCNEDDLMPVSVGSTTIMDYDEDEDCDEEESEEPEEVGAEEAATSSTSDMMFSDSPSTAEGSGFTTITEIESEFTEGSGSEPTLSTIESSGSEPTETTGSFEESTGTTESSATDETSGTETTESSATEESLGTTTESSGSTDISATEGTGSTEISATEGTGSTDSSGTTESTTDSDTTDTDGLTETDSTDLSSTGTEETGSTGTTDASSGGTTGTEITETSGSEGSTTESGATESSVTESDITETTSSDVSTESTGSSTTGSDITETGSTETGSTGSDATTELGNTESVSTESGTTNESGATGTESTESDATAETETEITGSDATTESVTTETGSTGSGGTTESGPTESDATTESGGTETEITGSDATTESGTTETGSTETGGTTESGTTETGSTESEGTTETGTTETGGSSESEATDSSESTASGITTESGATDSTLEGSSTIEMSEGSTEETTEWSWSSTVVEYHTKGRRVCKRRKKSKCKNTPFGCCPDKVTPAGGPFELNCTFVKTCKLTLHGCCPDGVSPATGPKHAGCPTIPCKETLFGCCKTDNKTPAVSNDQKECPPPPPPCKASKYGCCKDGKTQATGPKKKGCPETAPKKPVEGCAGSKFGCCADNKTAATGPQQEGCPCDNTEFGCCPDGVSSARGPEMEGCVMSCNTSAYGCCPDGETPAHGPEDEGCCLQQPFGCCPDNYKPAEGPHWEGCGCQYAHFGCCPDNATVARGPNNEGCGCQYTQFGCCPDRHTEASGPDNEGCGCHTYQFGCCPDGSTVAKGPSLQGCHCQQSKFGCCGDGQTAATGPDQAGCDCSTSKYGCCPDGQTEAKGEKFLGCTDVPENRQAACGLAHERGPCRNYTAYWFYDTDYGGCSRFWYGGCEGNGNRFTSQEECHDVCEQPAPKDACKLPQVKGACKGYYLRWYYDSVREQCGQFVYGGCLGNNNNFESREICQEHCEPARSEDTCSLPIERGSCAGNFGRWGFDPETRRCQQFIWGGCEGNANRFSSEAACVMRCDAPGVLKPECSEPQQEGNCTEKVAAWSFSRMENRCVPFYYTGCGGNGNRFESEQTCTETCPSSYVQDLCTLPAVTGDCADYREKWYYDTAAKRCRQFYYGGCGGNGNNFASEGECEARCKETARVTTTPAPQEPEPFRPEFCFLPLERGPCTGAEQRWAYDAARGACAPFDYGGCAGNRNNFPSREYCQHYCEHTQDICQMPMLAGPCDDSLMRYFYDPASDACSLFTYGGCAGNGNNFESLIECERRCRSGQPTPVTTTPAPRVQLDESIPRECQIAGRLEECAGARGGEVWYYEPSERGCTVHSNGNAGPYCRATGIFPTEEACRRSCELADTSSDPCKQQPDPGSCSEYHINWYFVEERNSCLRFVYTGCGGNGNRFETEYQCETQCKSQLPQPATTTTTEPPRRPQEPVEEECRTPASLAPCGENVMRFYYDEAAGRCMAAGIGNCRYANIYRSEEECERRCGAFRGQDPCNTPLHPGPCRGSFPKIYWDAARGRCEPFTYGGCNGGPNRFSSIEECEELCGAASPDPACLQAVDTGASSCAALAQRRYYFNQQHGDCRSFVYSGCGGNTNNFDSYEECEDLCMPDIRLPEPEDQEPEEPEESSGEPDTNLNEVVPECSAYEEECRRIECPYSVQYTRTGDGCQRCSCVSVDIDCTPLQQECDALRCAYGVNRTTGPDGCERCRCKDPAHPCEGKECPAGERCVANGYRDPISQEVKYAAECRTANKPGACPAASLVEVPASCRRECNDDADCRGVGKCCEVSCSQLCLEPATPTNPAPRTTTYSPELPQAPHADSRTQPQVTSGEGSLATLRCLFHGNPPPKITWRRGEITIDGTVGRYRLLSDGALEIVSLYRNDSGVYICVADNGLGVARQEIHLQVNDPKEGPAEISGAPNAVVVGELGRSLNIRCLAYGFPEPAIYWYRGLSGPMVPFSSSLYEARGNVLQIIQLSEETLGEYACQAYNGRGKAATWSVLVEARGAGREVDVTPRQPRTEPAPRTPPPEIDVPVYQVPVSTRLAASESTVAPGAELSLPCEVDGYPLPDVTWTKDGAPLASTDRITVTESRLTIRNVEPTDSGVYGCHARNYYSEHYSTIQINVQGIYVPSTCTDNPFFADCKLIVRSKFCRHRYYSKFCCKSCVEAGQLDPSELTQADEAWRQKK